jgi:hypothetical protein
MASEPTCGKKGGCEAPLSAIKLSWSDNLVLKLFTRVPWIEVSTFSGQIVKRSLDMVQAKVIAESMGFKWTQFLMDRLSICSSVIIDQQRERLLAEEANQSLKDNR